MVGTFLLTGPTLLVWIVRRFASVWVHFAHQVQKILELLWPMVYKGGGVSLSGGDEKKYKFLHRNADAYEGGLLVCANVTAGEYLA